MKKQKYIRAFASGAVAMLCTLTSQATIWRVNNNPSYTQGCNHCFSTLQAANDTSVVMAGDTIHLEASQIEYDAATITKQLVIIGTGYFLTDNPGLQKNSLSSTIRGITFDTLSQGSQIKGVRLHHSSNSADINIKVSDILVEGCWVERYVDFVAGTTYSPINNVTIKQSYIWSVNNSNNGVAINNLLISNCYIYDRLFLNDQNNSVSGIITQCVISNDGSLNDRINFSNGISEFYNNIVIHTSVVGSVIQQNNNNTTNVHDNVFIPAPPAWLTGGNNYSETLTSVFPVTGSPDSILNVNPIGTCPVCYTAFPGNATFGIFGGADPYRLSGIPNIPAIYQLQCLDSILQGGIANIDISTRGISVISEVEYFWDVDSGFNIHSDTVYSFPVTDISNGILYANVPFNLGLGTHLLFARSKDSQGKWSHTNYADSIQVTGTVSINEFINETGVQVYPNPFTDKITIKPKENKKIRVMAYDIEGREVIDRVINSTACMDTENLVSGTYLICVLTDNKVYQFKMIKND